MLWNGIAAVLSRGLPVLGMILAARILGREAFGQLGIAHSTAMMLQVFAVAGLGVTATTFVARWRKADPERAGRIIVLCYAFTLLSGGSFLLALAAGAEHVADAVLAAPELADELYVAGFLMFAVTLSAVQTGMLIGFQAYRDMAAANFVGGAASALLVALGAYLAGVQGALGASPARRPSRPSRTPCCFGARCVAMASHCVSVCPAVSFLSCGGSAYRAFSPPRCGRFRCGQPQSCSSGNRTGSERWACSRPPISGFPP